jgi:hypothetical protein
MPRNSIAYEILIASPCDVAWERNIVAEVLADWNSVPRRQVPVI